MSLHRRPDVLHAGTPKRRRAKPFSRAEWRRHLGQEPPGLLRKYHRPTRPAIATVAA